MQCGDPGRRDDVRPGKDGAGWHGIYHAAESGVHFRTYELFVSGIFDFMFSDCG